MLYIVATPIGNLEDITLRALRILKEVDFILAEDTRRAGFLLNHFGIKKPLHSFYEHNELEKLPWIIEELKKGKHIALVSNAGTPTLSDPGYKLVRACRKESLPLTSLPGPSSITNAVALTAIPHERFIFLGYMPRKATERTRLFGKLKSLNAALVFFESPFRFLGTLRSLRDSFGNRRIAVMREMTKKFEEVLELDIEVATRHFEKNKPKGEFTLILDNRDEAS